MNHRQLIVPSMFLALVTAVACDKNDSENKPQETETTSAQKTKIEDVKDQPSAFYGKRMTLTGEVDDAKSDGRSFQLEGSDWLFKDELRVLTRSPVKLGGAPLRDDEQVVVTGTLRKFVRADLDRELGWDLTPELEIELREKPVLIADEIRRVQSDAAWTAQKPDGEIVSIVTLVTAVSPDALAGQKISLGRETVQTVTGKGIWVGPGHASQTFVLPAAGTDISKLKAGDVVEVRGTIKKTPPAEEAIKSWGLPTALKSVVEREPLYIEASRLEPVKGSAAPKSSMGAGANKAKGTAGEDKGGDAGR